MGESSMIEEGEPKLFFQIEKNLYSESNNNDNSSPLALLRNATKNPDGTFTVSNTSDVLHIIPGTSNKTFFKAAASAPENVVYTAIFFNTDQVVDTFGQVHPNLYSHHSTIAFKPESIEGLPVGEDRSITVVGRLTNDKVDALVVENPLSKNKIPHITLSTADGVRPFESNTELENNQDKIEPLNIVLTGVVGYFNGDREVTSRFQNINEVKPTSIKPGIQELFDSNPELANQVYEALGFKNNISIPDYEVVTRPSKDIGKSKGRSGNFVEITTPDNYRTNMSAYMVQTNNEGKLFITDIEKYNEDSTFKGFGTAAYVDFFENYKNQGITTDTKLTKDGIKLLERLEKIGLVYKTDAKLIDDTQVSKVFDTKIYEYNKPLYEFNLNWKNNQITPQQKQQALQQYSQYLEQNPNGNIEGFKEFVNNDEELPMFKTDEFYNIRPENSLNFIEQQQFKSSIDVGDVITFSYWSETTSKIESVKDVLVTSIEDDRFNGNYENDEDRTFKFINILNTTPPAKYSLADINNFKRSLKLRNTVKIFVDNESITGAVKEIKENSIGFRNMFLKNK
jgi:hypothetical protein